MKFFTTKIQTLFFFKILFSYLLLLLVYACGENRNNKSPNESPILPTVIFSTDIAIGLKDTHGGQGSLPVTLNKNGKSSIVTPQDSDDGFTVAMALNLEKQYLLKVDAVVPTFGNATLPAEMLIARKIVYELKGATSIPVVPGANVQVSQTLQPTPAYYNGATVPIAGTEGSFCAACGNSGVDLMYERLVESEVPITILAIGPLTDVACLLMTHPEVKPKIEEVIVLASRIEGESVTINGVVVNDFNFRMDPIGGALFLYAAEDIPVKLISFALSGQTSQTGERAMQFDSTTLPGPTPSSPASERSLKWLLEATAPRNAFWKSIFKAEEGPFDQYTLVAAIQPDLFKCQEGLAYVQMCPYPTWSTDYQISDTTYNAPNNPCTDHAPGENSLSQVPAQLVVTLDLSDTGSLIRGTTGIDGNIPQLNATARKVTVCTDFASDEAFEEFKKLIYENTW